MAIFYDDTPDKSIPKEIMIALEHTWYKGDNSKSFASVTGLIKPPKMFWGNKLIEKDTKPKPASKYLYALEGGINHCFFEEVFGKIDGFKPEQEVSVDYRVGDKVYPLRGTSDLIDLEDNVLTDWKNMNVKKYQRNEFPDYVAQLNIYAYIINVLYKKGMFPKQVKKLKIVAKLRDWSAMDLMKFKDKYPIIMYRNIPVRLWGENEARAFIDTRIKTLDYYSDWDFDDIPECSMKDRWQRDATYPVFSLTADGKPKGNAQRGTASFTHPEQGKEWIDEKMRNPKNKNKYKVVERKSFPLRCFEYCDTGRAGLCNWFNENKNKYE